MILGRFAIAAAFLAALGSLCAAADHRLLVLEGSFVKWGKPQWAAAASVTYAFAVAPVNSPGARNCASLRPFADFVRRSGLAESRLRAETASAFAAWTEVTGLGFREIQDAARADIVIGAQANPQGRAFTNVELDVGPSAETATAERGLTPAAEPSSIAPKPHGLRAIRKSLICFNPLQKWKIGFDGDLSVYDIRYTLTHEIGHAIGLDHPGASGALMGFRYDEKQKGLTQGDIDAVRRLYGAR